MSGKNIYFIQPGYSFGEGGQKPGAYIPYASGAIAAFAWDNTYIKGTFILKDFVFLFEDIDEAAGRLDTPFLCAFSNYVWNFEYNKSFAQKIKSLYPECITVFGGHQIPHQGPTPRQCGQKETDMTLNPAKLVIVKTPKMKDAERRRIKCSRLFCTQAGNLG